MGSVFGRLWTGAEGSERWRSVYNEICLPTRDETFCQQLFSEPVICTHLAVTGGEIQAPSISHVSLLCNISSSLRLVTFRSTARETSQSRLSALGLKAFHDFDLSFPLLSFHLPLVTFKILTLLALRM